MKKPDGFELNMFERASVIINLADRVQRVFIDAALEIELTEDDIKSAILKYLSALTGKDWHLSSSVALDGDIEVSQQIRPDFYYDYEQPQFLYRLQREINKIAAERAEKSIEHHHHGCNCSDSVNTKSPQKVKDIKEKIAFGLNCSLDELVINKVKETIAKVSGNTNINELNFSYKSSGFNLESRELTDMTLQIEDNKINYSISLEIPRAAYEAFQQNLYQSE